MKRFLLGASIVTALVGLAPVWTAQWVEAKRKESLQRDSRNVDMLPPSCPADDSFFVFLNRHDAPPGPVISLWQPVCQKAEPPIGKVTATSMV